MWEAIKWILTGSAILAVGGVIFLAIVYLVSGIQARAWLDVYSKFLDDKLKK